MNHHLGNQWVVMVQCQDNRPSRGCPAVSCKYKTSSVIVNCDKNTRLPEFYIKMGSIYTLGLGPRHWPVHRTGVLLVIYNYYLKITSRSSSRASARKSVGVIQRCHSDVTLSWVAISFRHTRIAYHFQHRFQHEGPYSRTRYVENFRNSHARR